MIPELGYILNWVWCSGGRIFVGLRKSGGSKQLQMRGWTRVPEAGHGSCLVEPSRARERVGAKK